MDWVRRNQVTVGIAAVAVIGSYVFWAINDNVAT
jgi:hypothetical protein